MYVEATRCACKGDWLWVRSPVEVMKYLFKFIFPFLCFGVEAKRCVEFRYSTYNLTLSSAYPAVCGIQREADTMYVFILYVHAVSHI